jgi:hypothetical protein
MPAGGMDMIEVFDLIVGFDTEYVRGTELDDSVSDNDNAVVSYQVALYSPENKARWAGTAAQNGDIAAATLILKRCWPETRGRPVRLTLPPIRTVADTVAAAAVVVGEVSKGTISPEEGQAVASIIEVQRRTIETTDLAARLEALERGGRQR